MKDLPRFNVIFSTILAIEAVVMIIGYLFVILGHRFSYSPSCGEGTMCPTVYITPEWLYPAEAVLAWSQAIIIVTLGLYAALLAIDLIISIVRRR